MQIHVQKAAQDMSVMLFKIPNIDNLFIFRKSMSNETAMVSIVVELLKNDHLEILYVGHLPEKAYNYDAFSDDNKNCAIICITVFEKKLVKKEKKKSIALFVKELEKTENRIAVKSKVLNEPKNISSIAIVVKTEK